MSDLSWMRPRLAELCGYTSSYENMVDETDTNFGWIYQRQGDFVWAKDWRPDEDVAQAVRVLEALYNDSWAFVIGRGDTDGVPHDVVMVMLKCRRDGREIVHTEDLNTPLPRAICLAIAAALGWEEPK